MTLASRARAAAVGSVLLLVAIATPVAAAPAPEAGPTPAGWVTQLGTYDYLVQPDYDGLAPLRDVVGASTIGLGTFDHLDGELVMLRGTVYRVGTDGTPREVTLGRTSPFFEAVRFSPQASVRVPDGTQCSALVPLIDQLAGTQRGMVAVRAIGTFTTLTARSVPAQSEPYPPLSEVVATQTVFPLTGVRATLVGFRTGTDLLGIGAPGLHLHGLTADRSAGGHILSCTASGDVRLAIQRTRGVTVHSVP